MMDFLRTRTGGRFFEVDVPNAVKAINRLAAAVEDHAKPLFSLKTAAEAESKPQHSWESHEDYKARISKPATLDRYLALLDDIDKLWGEMSEEEQHVALSASRRRV